MIKTCQRADLKKKLGNQVLDHMPVHIGQSVVPPLKTVSQLFMVKTKQVQKCGVQVMHVYSVFLNVVTKFVC